MDDTLQAAEAIDETPAEGAPETVEVAVTEGEAGEAAAAPEGEVASEETVAEIMQDPRFREVVKGIHPELLCMCPECVEDNVELQWFSPEEKVKTKGSVMLYCQRSSRKYFSPAVEFQAWLAEKPVAKGRGRG